VVRVVLCLNKILLHCEMLISVTVCVETNVVCGWTDSSANRFHYRKYNVLKNELNIFARHILFSFHLWRYSPNLGLGLPPWNSPFHFGLLDLRYSVGLLVRVISSSQGPYLYTNTKYLFREWYSNPRSRLQSERRQYVPQTVRLPWPATRHINNIYCDSYFEAR
jgi:hypothetical protein